MTVISWEKGRKKNHSQSEPPTIAFDCNQCNNIFLFKKKTFCRALTENQRDLQLTENIQCSNAIIIQINGIQAYKTYEN